jgi:lipoprotein-anchoring transpeptidase ErfK/SrfK
MTVSTGRKGYETRVGKYVVTRQWDNWHNSTLYGVPLYKTSYFSGGQAVHGLVSDSLVKPYPASAGCVRMTKKDAKWVYDRVKNRNITIKGKWQE